MSERARRKQRKPRRHAASVDAASEPELRKPSEPEARAASEHQPREPPEPVAGGDMARGYARSRARDEAARAALKPLDPGERPTAVTVAAVVTAVVGLVNLGAYLAGLEVSGERPAVVGILLFTGLMLAAAWGAWNVRYWAVLGIQALLGLTILIFSLLAVKSQDALELAIAVAIIGGAGTLFWHLVKSMARIQMPERPGAG
ncbi:MAG: hypothetical protein M3433_05300 [Actinomycetota bacterium]|nr:hypothetical protein [Actinomycetota bacterium]MDQ3647988.1 hypothetical protein [Actinomycetota bacterium]